MVSRVWECWSGRRRWLVSCLTVSCVEQVCVVVVVNTRVAPEEQRSRRRERREQMHFLALHWVGVIGFLFFLSRLIGWLHSWLARHTLRERGLTHAFSFFVSSCLLGVKSHCICIFVRFLLLLLRVGWVCGQGACEALKGGGGTLFTYIHRYHTYLHSLLFMPVRLLPSLSCSGGCTVMMV